MKKLNWTTEERKIDALIPYDKNPRILTTDQKERLKKSLEKFGLVEIPAIDLDNKIIAGHQRLKVLKILGRGNDVVDVRVPNRKLTRDEYEQYLLSSNSIDADWDYSLLQEYDIDFLKDSGFDDDLLEDVYSDIDLDEEDEFNEKTEINKIKETNIKEGDLIILGKHRLFCGDSNNEDNLNRLFNSQKCSMIMSDPIYNIDLDYRTGLGGKQDYGADVEDKRSTNEYIDFLRSNISNALKFTEKDCHVFYWNTEQHIWILQTLYNELGIKNKRVCLWIKNGQNPTPQVAFSKCYEPCIYGTIGSPFLSKKHQGYNEVLNDDTTTGNNLLIEIEDSINLWTEKRLSSSEYRHATSKPVGLYEKSIRRCTKPGDIILDTFAGSGSTLIAGERLGRRVFAVEKENIFCQLICDRYKKLTGDKVEIMRK